MSTLIIHSSRHAGPIALQASGPWLVAILHCIRPRSMIGIEMICLDHQGIFDTQPHPGTPRLEDPEVAMRRNPLVVAIALASLSSLPAVAKPTYPGSHEAALAKLDLQQKDMVAKADADGLAALSSPRLTINAPTGRVLTRDQFIAMMRNGQIGAETFERTIESVAVSGDTGIVMGSEIFTPTAQSELGRIYGAAPLRRRYTNVYVREGRVWRWLARHANVIPAR